MIALSITSRILFDIVFPRTSLRQNHLSLLDDRFTIVTRVYLEAPVAYLG